MDFTTTKLLHGGDYNPEQWLDRPDILEKDVSMLTEAGCNVVSLGIFSWSTLEPEEGVFHFEWLEKIIQNLYEHGISTILATPSGALSEIGWQTSIRRCCGSMNPPSKSVRRTAQSLLHVSGLSREGGADQSEAVGTAGQSSGCDFVAYLE